MAGAYINPLHYGTLESAPRWPSNAATAALILRQAAHHHHTAPTISSLSHLARVLLHTGAWASAALLTYLLTHTPTTTDTQTKIQQQPKHSPSDQSHLISGEASRDATGESHPGSSWPVERMGEATQERRLFGSLDCRQNWGSVRAGNSTEEHQFELSGNPVRDWDWNLHCRVPCLLNDHRLCYWRLNIITADFLSWSLLSHPLLSSRLQLRVLPVRRIPRWP